ncbi:MAG: Fic family protein [Burkholderiales bacterium]|nr:Fic family protein [Burkholderiales bacterium]
MNINDFLSSDAGRVIEHPQGYAAFIPAPLPPKLQYDPDLVLLLSKADAALSELSGIGRILPNPHLLIAPWVRREAVLSSRIEGTRASLSDLLIDEMGGEHSAPRPHDDVREVRNYVSALEFGIKRLDELPLSLRLVREIHERLMKGVRGDKATPGEFRRSQNWIGPQGSTPVTAAYVPPPVDAMNECLHDWEQFIHVRDAMPDLVQCAIMHQQFEAIHPFLDGNGRVGRLLITLFLIERKRLNQPLLYLSAYIEEHRQDYYDLLQRVRTHGDWNAWIRYFITGVNRIATEAAKQSAELLGIREKFRALVKDKPRALELVDALFTNPYVTVARAAVLLNVSNPTARKAVELLAAKGILERLGEKRWGKVYLCRAILDAIELE